MAQAAQIERLLKVARTLIRTPGSWCQNYAAMDAQNTPCFPATHMARRWCLLGALEHAQWITRSSHAEFTAAQRIVRKHIPSKWRTFSGFNDNLATTHEMVMDVLNRGIEDVSHVE